MTKATLQSPASMRVLINEGFATAIYLDCQFTSFAGDGALLTVLIMQADVVIHPSTMQIFETAAENVVTPPVVVTKLLPAVVFSTTNAPAAGKVQASENATPRLRGALCDHPMQPS